MKRKPSAVISKPEQSLEVQAKEDKEEEEEELTEADTRAAQSQEEHDKMLKDAALKSATATAVAKSKEKPLEGKEDEKHIVSPMPSQDDTAVR